jgi:hypothetical protein
MALYPFDSVSFWTGPYTSCINNWVSNTCDPFFSKYAPLAISACNSTLQTALNKLSGLYDLPYPTYGYSYSWNENRRVGFDLSREVRDEFSWAMSSVCTPISNNVTRSACIVQGLNLTQELSCSHSMYANDAGQNGAGVLGYALPLLATAYLCYTSMPSLSGQNELAEPLASNHKPRQRS